MDPGEADEEDAPTARQERRRRERKEREERERERDEREREAREQKEREAREQKEREAREQKEREARATAIDSKPAPAAEPRPKPQPLPTPPSKPAAAPVAEGIVLLLGPGTPSIGASTARKAYLGQTTVWSNGIAARPISRSSSSAAAKRFARSVLGMSTGAFGEHWSELQLSGGGLAPPAVSSAAAMLSKVAATKGAIGYVLASELPASPAGVRVVRVD